MNGRLPSREDDLLTELLASLRPAPVPANGDASADESIDTRSVILRLVDDHADLDGCRADLSALCRKLEVAGVVRTSYAAGWKRLPGSDPIDSSHSALLAGVLLATATRHLQAREERDRGAALKALNAAFKCLDLIASPEDPAIQKLTTRAEALLDQITVSSAQ